MLRSFLKFSTLTALALPFFIPANSMAQEPAKAKDGGAITVELLEAGQAPLQKLRFTPKAGDKSNKVMTMKMRQGINGVEPRDLPAQQIFLSLEVKNVSASGDIEFEFKYTDMKVVTADGNPSALASTIESLMKPIVGTGGVGKVNDRGVMLSSEYKVPQDLSPNIKTVVEGMKDAMKNLSMPLPEQPVGVGAKWKTVQPVNANGIQLDQIIHTEMTALNAQGFAIKLNIAQDAKAQEVKNPLLPEGTSLKLESLDTSGEGNSDVLFSELLPKKSSTKVHSKTAMNILVGQNTQKLTTDMTLEVTFEDTPSK